MIDLFSLIVSRTRQHHAIEHATLHVLAEQHPHRRFSGHSDPLGFTLYGDVELETVRQAVGQALLRLQAGESNLALHPNCGTNLATSGLMATAAALLASALVRRGFLERFALALILVLPSLVMARPIGLRLQAFTTLADVSDRWVADVQVLEFRQVRAYRVLFD
jgi:hypothetical protein